VTVAENTTNGITVDDQSSLTCTKCLISANLGRGIDAAGGRLTISQSVIRDNMNGGIRAQDDTSFQIVGNIIYHNGLSTRTAAGGIFIQVNAPPADFVNQVDFNTLSANMGSDGGQGIQCMAVTSLTTSNNLIWDNGLTPAAAMQVFGSGCSYRYSDIGPMGIGTDNANMSMPPAFDSAPGKLLHLSTGSPVLGKADPTADLRGLAAFDVDGDPRVGPNVDIGADEMP
jgi:hypothetical protein